ncbi:hypothetical protein JZ751_027249, partial [Albula glossodonta]
MLRYYQAMPPPLTPVLALVRPSSCSDAVSVTTYTVISSLGHGHLELVFVPNICPVAVGVHLTLQAKGSYTLSPAALTHSGEYRCRAGRGTPVWYTEYSEPVHIQASALPKATLTVEPKWSPLYTGETVTLKCEVDSHSNWKYVWYKDKLQTAVSQTAGHSVSGDRYSITAAAGSDQGQYWCEGRLEGRKVTSQRSDPITLSVKDRLVFGLGAAPLLLASIILCVKCYRNRVKPQPVLSVPVQREIYEGESVSLSCRVTVPSAGWEYYWYKDVQYYGSHYKPLLSRGAKGSYTLSPAALTHTGEYRCRAGRGTPVWVTEYSEPVHIQVSALPKATLTVEPKWSPLYTGETVTLKCEVDSHSNWTYFWYKDQLQTAVSQTAGHSISGDRYSITAAAGSDQGQYWCEGRLEALPKATLTIEPKWSPLYTGETVTLKCEVDSHSNWTYVWYKNQLQTAVSQTAGHSVSGDRYSITAAAGSDQGQYWCEGRLEGRKVTSQRSDPITLTVKALPKATLTVEPKWSPLYTGETVTLKCEVDSHSNWTYFWYINQSHAAIPSTSEYNVTITAAAGSDQGQYWCEGRQEGRTVTSQRSDPITLTVKDRLVFGLGAAPLLLASIILCVKCYRNRGWSKEAAVRYTEENRQEVHRSIEDSYTITSAAVEESGSYECCVNETQFICSTAVRLTVSEKPRPVLSVSLQREIYEGESVSLSCRVTVPSAGWEYYWEYKDVRYYGSYYKPLLSSGAKDSYTLSPAALTHSGQYRCRAGRGTSVWYTEYSEPVHIQVSALPKATLTIEPKWRPAYYKETVTLKCEVDSHSARKYVWYKDQLQTAVSQTAGHSVSGDRYSIIAAAGSDQGQYWCEGRLEGRKVTSQRSDPITLKVKGSYNISPATEAHSGSYKCCLVALHDTCSAAVTLSVSALPKAALSVEPKWSLLYTGETVTLKCEVDSHSNWKYVWYKGRSRKVLPQTAGHSVRSDRYSITAAAGSDQGQYWCEGRLEGRKVTSQRSDPITLTVKALPRATLTVEPKWSPLYTGETVTLKCEVDSHSNWKYVWYKDQLQTAMSQTAGHSVSGDRYSIPAAAGSDQGQYWCEGRLEGRKVTSQRSDLITLNPSSRNPVTIQVSALHRATLTVEPKWSPLYAGRTINLMCGLGSRSNLTSIWYKGQFQMAVSQTAGHSVRVQPKATLTVEPKSSPLYTGETVTLKCEVDPHSNWTYFWFINQSHTASPSTSEYNQGGRKRLIYSCAAHPCSWYPKSFCGFLAWVVTGSFRRQEGESQVLNLIRNHAGKQSGRID